MFNQSKLEVIVGGKTIVLETGKIARQAGGSIKLQCGDTVVLSTACASPSASADIDFLPLRVDYQERFSSVGRTAAGFIKREGRPAEREILTSRLIDRPLRPMFPDGFYKEVQVLSYVLSYDNLHQGDVLAICASSAALVISDIPLVRAVGAVRVGMIDGKFVINPTVEDMLNSKLDLIIAGTEKAVLMIEGYCDFLTEDQVLEAITTGHNAIAKFCVELEAWGKKIGKPKNLDGIRPIPNEVTLSVKNGVESDLKVALKISAKQEREKAIAVIKEDMMKSLFPEGAPAVFSKVDVAMAFKALQASIMRNRVLDTKVRIDGRALNEIRQIDVEQAVLPRTHGSSLFTRGETQALAVCTLGSEGSGQRFEDLHGEGLQRFILQYSFPPYSVGEVGRMGTPGRREVGHGKLAERALLAIMPKDYSYVVRIEANITESNGSSSMASVCGGCLSMMDAGVPIKRPVSGIAMGLILEGEKFAILSDILGAEDALGDMDFKITGDNDGITAFQMDIKVEGISIEIMKAALAQAKAGRSHILSKMLAACPEAREEMSQYAPRIEEIKISPKLIGKVIGPGGKMIRQITEETGVTIDIDDSGIVRVASTSQDAMKAAIEMIQKLTAEVEIGKIYEGTIVSVKEFGFFVEVIPGMEGLCHISEIGHKRLATIEESTFKQGDKIRVKVLEIDPKTGKIKLSAKALLDAPAK
jgi:polyribonucleotide nucleotidyltransferase